MACNSSSMSRSFSIWYLTLSQINITCHQFFNYRSFVPDETYFFGTYVASGYVIVRPYSFPGYRILNSGTISFCQGYYHPIWYVDSTFFKLTTRPQKVTSGVIPNRKFSMIFIQRHVMLACYVINTSPCWYLHIATRLWVPGVVVVSSPTCALWINWGFKWTWERESDCQGIYNLELLVGCVWGKEIWEGRECSNVLRVFVYSWL